MIKQAGIIFAKDAIIATREIRGTVIKAILMISLGYFYGVYPGLSMKLPILLGIIIGVEEGVSFVGQQVENKIIRLRDSIRLMGVSDLAYFIGTITLRLCITQIYLFIALLTAFIWYGGQYGIFASPFLFFNFWVSFSIYMLSTLAFFSILSESIQDLTNAKEVVGMIVAIIAIYPLLMCFKDGPADFTTFELILFIITPQGSYFQLCKEIFMKRSSLLESRPLLILCFQSIQALIFSLIYLWMEGYITKKLSSTSAENIEDIDDLLELPCSFESITEGESILKLSNLTIQFGEFVALDHIETSIKAGSITCILGHNGAGKSTLMNSILGLIKPSTGEIFYRGFNVHKTPGLLDGRIGYCTSLDLLHDNLTVSEYLMFVAMIKGVEHPADDCARLIHKCKLNQYISQFCKNLSGGTRRRVSIASAMIGKPDIVFMDEPSSGVDPDNRIKIWELINEIKGESTIILTTHHMEEAQLLANDLMILNQGKIAFQGTSDKFMATFGLGYTIYIDTNHLAFDSLIAFADKENLILDLETSFPSLQIPITSKPFITTILKSIESMYPEGKVHITSNSLESAYLSLLSSSPRALTLTDTDTFHSTPSSIFCALLTRRFLLLVTSSLHSLRFISLCILPSIMLYSLTSPSRLTLPQLYILPFCIIGVYLTNCSFFALLPHEERVNGIRFMLKTLGVTSVSYYTNLGIADSAAAAAIVVGNYSLLFLMHIGTRELQLLDWEVLKIILLTISWSLGFVADSYVLQFLVKRIERIPFIIAGINLSAVPLVLLIPVFLVIGLSGIWIKSLFYLIFFLAPMAALVCLMIQILVPEIYEKGDMAKDFFLYPSISGILLNPIVCFSVAIIIDWVQNRVSNGTVAGNIEIELDGLNNEGRELRIEKQNAMVPSSNYPLQADRISKKYYTQNKQFYALNGVSLTLRRGETLALIGPNGAGKSTLFKILSTYESPSNGRVYVNGKALKTNSPFFKETGICQQHDVLWNTLSVKQHSKIIRMIFGVSAEIEDKWLEVLELKGFEKAIPSQLSSGMRRKLSFLMCSIHNPKNKFLDEPTTGLDPMARKIFRDILKLQKQTFGSSSILTTHTMEDAEESADRIAILINGELKVIDSLESLHRKTGGITVTIYNVGQKHDGQVIKSTLSTHVNDGSKWRMLFENNSKVMYEVTGVDKLSPYFENLERMKADHFFEDYSISRLTLQELFLRMVEDKNTNRADNLI